MKTKLAKAVSLAVAGLALSASASNTSAHVMYNTALATDQVGGTDGWVWNGQGNPGYATGTYTPWLGTAGGALPFGYSGATHLNWAAAIHDSDVLTVSEAAAAAAYNGAQVEIDTGAGAWRDVNGTGWKHQTDLGLIKADFSTLVRINISRVGTPSDPGLPNDNFGVTIYEGMSAATTYSHHGRWNCPTVGPGCNAAQVVNYDSTAQWGANNGLVFKKYDATVDATNYIEFFANAGQVYTVALGGNGVGTWAANVSDYALTVQAVPVPGAVWLFGSAMAGLIGFGGRRKAAVAA